MSSSKKKQRNGFFYFMLDMKEDLRRQGRNVQMAQMSAIAGPKWSALPEADKAAYNLRAKHEKRNASSSAAYPQYSHHHQGKMDCAGELLSERKDILAELEEKRRRQNEEIKTLLTSTETLCELKELKKEKWLPCEMAAVEFSLVHGIHGVLHHFIEPGPIPMGYRYEAQSQSERTHVVPIEGFKLANGNYRQILHDLEQFMNPPQSGASPVCSLVFAKRGNVERVEFLLNWLAKKAGIEPVIDQVYELEALLKHLDTLSSCNDSSISLFQASELLKTSAYDYETGTCCGWHEAKEVKFCSVSTVKIYSFVMADHLCPKFSIPITPSHLPEQSTLPAANIIQPLAPPRLQMPRGVQRDPVDLPPSGGRGRGRGLSKLPVVRQPKCAAQSMK